MKKREQREMLYKALFSVDSYSDEEYKDQAKHFLSTEELGKKDEESIDQKLKLIIEKKDDIDKIIEDKSIGWQLSRIAKTDLAALRLGIYEIVYDDDVSFKVAINEAVNLASAYGTEKSASFVNGILGAVVSDENIKKVEKSERVKEADKKATQSDNKQITE